MINAHDFMLTLKGFESWSCTDYQDALYYLAILSLSFLICKTKQNAHLLEWSLEFDDMLYVKWLAP